MKKMIYIKMLTGLLLIVGFYNCTFSQSVGEQWVATYNGPSGTQDEAKSMVVDSYGNVYVTGSCCAGPGTATDICTIKYNAAGIMQWVARYHGLTPAYNSGVGIKVDINGYVYVLGSIYNTNSDLVTIKYSPIGEQVWASTFDNINRSNDFPIAIGIDNSGCVYVTGVTGSLAPTIPAQIETIKYKPSGTIQWSNMYTSAGISDAVSAMVVDGSGNVYLIGTSMLVGYFYTTIKYNTGGTLLWNSFYNGTTLHGDSWGNAIAVDPAGNVYVTGQQYGQYGTVKYNSSGVFQWDATYRESALTASLGKAIAADASGNVYVTGYGAADNGSERIITFKYNSAGATIWVARYKGITGTGSNRGYCVNSDVSGNTYVSGYSVNPSGNLDFVTFRYSTAGIMQWLAKHPGPERISNYHTSMALDGLGNVYVAGPSLDAAMYYDDYVTIKYQQTGASKPTQSLENIIPASYALNQNYPNPFNPTTNIKFALPVDDDVIISVFDVTGQEVTKLINQKMTAGYHEVKFDGSGLSSGVYFYKITTSKFTEVKKMILTK